MGRRFGQHFLARQSILERIGAACGTDSPKIIEIGPGRGALTEVLLKGSSKVTAIEIDPVLIHYLRQKFQQQIESGRLELLEGDVLKVDLAGPEGAVIAGNLPYYITSPILERVFAAEGRWQRAVFLVQAEVAARLAASPGSRDYGYLSVLTQVHTHPQILFDVPRAAFRPPPKVDSAVVLLGPRTAGEIVEDRDGFLRFASECFRHKRKTLRNNLAARYGREKMDAMLESKLRAEQLSLAQMAELYRTLERP